MDGPLDEAEHGKHVTKVNKLYFSAKVVRSGSNKHFNKPVSYATTSTLRVVSAKLRTR